MNTDVQKRGAFTLLRQEALCVLHCELAMVQRDGAVVPLVPWLGRVEDQGDVPFETRLRKGF